MNPEVVLPLEKMSIAEKMDVIERIMSDLVKNSGTVPSPSWHGRVLEAREQALSERTDRFISLDEAERSIRERTGWRS